MVPGTITLFFKIETPKFLESINFFNTSVEVQDSIDLKKILSNLNILVRSYRNMISAVVTFAMIKILYEV